MRFFAATFAVALLGALASPATASGNLLQNPSFESDLTSWLVTSRWVPSDTSFFSTPAAVSPYHGTKVAQISGKPYGTDHTPGLTQTLSKVVPNGTYTLRARARCVEAADDGADEGTDNTTEQAAVKAVASIFFYDNCGGLVYRNNVLALPAVGTDWQTVSLTTTPPPGYAARVMIQVSIRGKAVVQFDQVELSYLGVANGDFETGSLSPWVLQEARTTEKTKCVATTPNRAMLVDASQYTSFGFGRYAVLLNGAADATATTTPTIYQSISNPDPGATYRVRFTARVITGDGSARRLFVRCRQFNDLKDDIYTPYPRQNENLIDTLGLLEVVSASGSAVSPSQYVVETAPIAIRSSVRRLEIAIEMEAGSRQICLIDNIELIKETVPAVTLREPAQVGKRLSAGPTTRMANVELDIWLRDAWTAGGNPPFEMEVSDPFFAGQAPQTLSLKATTADDVPGIQSITRVNANNYKLVVDLPPMPAAYPNLGHLAAPASPDRHLAVKLARAMPCGTETQKSAEPVRVNLREPRTKPAMLTEKGVYVFGGQSYFPIGMYGSLHRINSATASQADLEKYMDLLAAQGINSVIIPISTDARAINNWLNLGPGKGLKAMFHVSGWNEWSHTHALEDKISSLTAADHQKFLGFNLIDEPDIKHYPHNWELATSAVFRLLKRANGNNHPIVINMTGNSLPYGGDPNRWKMWGALCDEIRQDDYPIASSDLTRVAISTKAAVAARQFPWQHVSVALTCGWQKRYHNGVEYRGDGSSPSRQQALAMAYIAMMNGAQGIWWYAIDTSGTWDLTGEDFWTSGDFAAVNAAIRDVAPYVLEGTPVSNEGTNGLKCDATNVHYKGFVHGTTPRLYLMMTNATPAYPGRVIPSLGEVAAWDGSLNADGSPKLSPNTPIAVTATFTVPFVVHNASYSNSTCTFAYPYGTGAGGITRITVPLAALHSGTLNFAIGTP